MLSNVTVIFTKVMDMLINEADWESDLNALCSNTLITVHCLNDTQRSQGSQNLEALFIQGQTSKMAKDLSAASPTGPRIFIAHSRHLVHHLSNLAILNVRHVKSNACNSWKPIPAQGRHASAPAPARALSWLQCAFGCCCTGCAFCVAAPPPPCDPPPPAPPLLSAPSSGHPVNSPNHVPNQPVHDISAD